MTPLKLSLLSGLIGISVGLTTGWTIYRPKTTNVIQPEAKSERQKDGSLTVAIVKKENLDVVKMDPPKDTTRELRRGQIVLKPETNSLSQEGRESPLPAIPQTPISLMYTLTEQKDGQTRMTFKADGAEVVSGSEFVIPANNKLYPDLKWSAGFSYDISKRSYGAWVNRNTGPFVVGVQLDGLYSARGQDQEYGLSVKLGVRF